MTAVMKQQNKKGSRLTTIDKARAPLLADFLQKLDRMMTGLPVKVIIKSLDNGALSKTDGKRIWLDWKVLTTPYSNETRLGLNSKELSHCFFGNTNYDRKVKNNSGLSAASNILLTCRDITLFVGAYPSNEPYFISYVQEVLCRGRLLKDCGDVWPILYGLKFIPTDVRLIPAKAHNPAWVGKVSDLIDEFVCLQRDNNNIKRALQITKEFADLIKDKDIYTPGGGTLLKSMSDFKGRIDYIIRNIRLIVRNDRLSFARRVVINGASTHSYGGGSGWSTPTTKIERRSEKFIDGSKVVTRETRDIKYANPDITLANEIDALTSVLSNNTYVAPSHYGKNVANLNNTTPQEDLGLDTVHDGGGGSGGGPASAGGGPASAGGGDFSQIVIVDKGNSSRFTEDYVWVDGGNTYDLSDLATRKDALTTDSIKDILQSMQDEIMFDDPLLSHAGWGGCGFVTADLRKFKHDFVEELKLTAKTLRSRHAVGKRGPIHISAAMKAESGNPTSNIFRVKKDYTSRTQLNSEVVMLIDASGSMHGIINNVMKTQWLIGSSFESLGAKVTVIPFNNKARDPLKGRLDSYSETVYPYCSADGGTQPQGALTVSQDIFKKAGKRHKLLFILTDGAWNNSEWSHKIIDQLNNKGVQTVLVFMGGDRRDAAQLEVSGFHHCKLGTKINNADDLLPEMRRVFFKEFKSAIKKSLRVYH